MYFMSCILLRCKWLFGPFAFNKLIDWLDWLIDWLIGLWWYICTRRLYVRTRCSKCSVAVSSTELVMRVKQLVFHTVSPSQLYRFTYLLAYFLAVLLSSGKMVLITSLLVSHSIVKWVTIILCVLLLAPCKCDNGWCLFAVKFIHHVAMSVPSF